MKNTRVIAFYLPQFHPIKENDEWWGKGFTEWTNVAKAKPLFRGHYQPKIPADLGFYDLRLSETREAQAELAKEAGIEGFCYWHYWFGDGKMLLERPFAEVLESGKPDFPFCLAWANGSWTSGTWTKVNFSGERRTLIEQIYTEEDFEKHFYHVLPAFKDHRYLQVEGKPLFYVHDPLDVPNMNRFIEIWRRLAKENGLDGIYFVGRAEAFSYWKRIDGKREFKANPSADTVKDQCDEVFNQGFDAVNLRERERAEFVVNGKMRTLMDKVVARILKTGRLKKFDMHDINQNLFVDEEKQSNIMPTLLPNWDRTPRAGKASTIYINDTPEEFDDQIKRAIDIVKDKDDDHRIIFLQAWNEWAEGNYVEPDLKYGHGYLDVLAKHFKD